MAGEKEKILCEPARPKKQLARKKKREEKNKQLV